MKAIAANTNAIRKNNGTAASAVICIHPGNGSKSFQKDSMNVRMESKLIPMQIADNNTNRFRDHGIGHPFRFPLSILGQVSLGNHGSDSLGH